MRAIKLGFGFFILIALLSLLFEIFRENNELVVFRLYGYESSPTPKWAVVMISALVGALLTSLFFIVYQIILETKIVRLKRSNRQLERTLSKLQGTATDQSAEPKLNNDEDV